MNLKVYWLLLAIVSALHGHAQTSTINYIPEHLDSLQNYVSAVTLKKTNDFKGKYHKEIQKLLLERKESFIKDIKDSTFIFDKPIHNYLNGILREIYRANPEINKNNFYFFINKSPVPNAACYGNGIFTVNLGLLELIESDDQLAFVICHEIAHMVLKHSDVTMLSHVETMHSKETKKKISKASRMNYGRRQAVSEVLKDLSYNFLRRSRSAEIEADSLGFEFYAKTKYQKAAAAQILSKLDLADTLLFTSDARLRNHFTFEAYPFKEAWLTPDETIFDLKEAANDLAFDKDSLKTHPDIPVRLQNLEKLYKGNEPTSASGELVSVKKLAAQNTVIAAIDDSRIDMALYQILVLRDKGETDLKGYCNTVGNLLKKTFELKQNHQFGKFVSPVSPFSEEKYLNEVRIFLHNLELKNIRKIGWQFCQKYQTEMKGDPEFAKTTAFFEKLQL